MRFYNDSAAGVAVLSVCLSGTWAQGESGGADQGLQTRDVWDEQRAQRDTVVEQRVELKDTKAELQTQRDKVAGLEKENTDRKSTTSVMLTL